MAAAAQQVQTEFQEVQVLVALAAAAIVGLRQREVLLTELVGG